MKGDPSQPRESPPHAGGAAVAPEFPHGEARRVRYVFLDIVGFSARRTVEAQAHLIAVLNQVVRESLNETELSDEDIILLPTGDGMCIAIINERAAFDVNLRLALAILERVDVSSSRESDEMQKLSIRVGLNENTDNLIIDINKRRNVAGAGINLCQRIMSKADAGEILVGSATHEVLQYRERYYGHWKAFTAPVTHDVELDMFQFVEPGHRGLETKTPQAFEEFNLYEKRRESKLSSWEAYFFAHAERLREEIEKAGVKSNVNTAGAVMVALFMMARDSIESARSSGWGTAVRMLHYGGKLEPAKLFEYYKNQDIWVVHALVGRLSEEMEHRKEFFEGDGRHFVILKEAGVHKVATEWPEVCKELGVHSPLSDSRGLADTR